jgi:hypothetical protein
MANDNDGLTFFAPTETKLSDRKSAAQEGDEKRQLVQSIYAMVSDTEAPDTNKELLEAFESNNRIQSLPKSRMGCCQGKITEVNANQRIDLRARKARDL